MVGFDIDAATLTLYREALAAGAIPEGDDRQPGPQETAQAHLHEFNADGCKKSPCRTAGLCHALFELTQYRAEARDSEGVIAAADETELLRKALQKYGDRYVKTIEVLSQNSKKLHQHERDFGREEPSSQHQILCVLPVQALHEMNVLLNTLQTLESELRGRVWSFELQQSGDKKPGDLLLTAVYQHLRWGGLKYKEIARLVPDGGGTKGAADRVRARVKSPNARSMMPREMVGCPRDVRRRNDRRVVPPPDSGGNECH
jgi:hypothetical protein